MIAISRNQKIIAAVLLQTAVLGGIIIFKVGILLGGTEVLLQIQPVDPRDPFRGDYVTFSYAISTPPQNYFTYSPVREGDIVYVPLEKSGKYWVAKSGISKVAPTGGAIALKGTVTRVPRSGSPRIQYGIEEYFIPEGSGRNVSFWRRGAAALVAVNDKGNAVLKQLYVDGKPWPSGKGEPLPGNGNDDRIVELPDGDLDDEDFWDDSDVVVVPPPPAAPAITSELQISFEGVGLIGTQGPAVAHLIQSYSQSGSQQVKGYEISPTQPVILNFRARGDAGTLSVPVKIIALGKYIRSDSYSGIVAPTCGEVYCTYSYSPSIPDEAALRIFFEIDNQSEKAVTLSLTPIKIFSKKDQTTRSYRLNWSQSIISVDPFMLERFTLNTSVPISQNDFLLSYESASSSPEVIKVP